MRNRRPRALCRLLVTNHRPQATSRFPNTHPDLSPRGERCFAVTKPWIIGAAWAPDQVRDMPRLAGAKHPWPGTRLRLSTGLIPTPRTRPPPAAEIRGPYRTKRQDFVVAALPATSYALRAVPSLLPRTTYYEPAGGHTGPPLRREKCTTSHEPQLRATSRRPLTAVSTFQPSEPGQTGAVSVARGRSG